MPTFARRPSRKDLFRPRDLLAAIACGVALFSCASHHQPSIEAAKAVVVEKFVDPRTVSVHGSVSVSVHVPPHARNRSEEYALDALKAEALREHPGTTLLFGVTLKAGSDANGIVASGVAARSRGD